MQGNKILLREDLDTNGINIQKFAVLIGCSNATVHRLLRGDSDCLVTLALKIKKQTHDQVSVEELVHKVKK